MPTIYDNIEQPLSDGLRARLDEARRADFCVGYFRLRGWSELADLVDHFAGAADSCCRVLVGMHRPPEEEMCAAQSAASSYLRPKTSICD